MDDDFAEARLPPAASPVSPPKSSGRYDFEVPEHLTISDMLAIQLAECVRITHVLSDYASDPQLRDCERLHTIHSLGSVVKASEKLTRTIGRLRTGSWDEDAGSSRPAKG